MGVLVRLVGRVGLGLALSLAATLALGLAAVPALAAAPSITTDGATATGLTTATVSGSGDANGPAATVHADFGSAGEPWCTSHGTNGTPSTTASQPLGSGTAMVSEILVKLANLSPGNEYCAELVAENEDGTAYGGQVHFTMPSTGQPSVFEESVTGITEHDATLEASINPNGLKTSYQFRLESGCLPPRACLAITTYPLPSGEIPASHEVHPVSLDLNSAGVTLERYTEYRYSLEATNSAGTTQGPGQLFTTAPARAPTVEGESASNITPTDATLEAKINPEGLETTYEVWVGALPCVEEFGGPERCEEDKVVGTIPAGFSASQVSVDIAKASHQLKPNSPYLYSFHAANMDGTTYGGNKEFKTGVAAPPSIESESVLHITPSDATLEAQINTAGLETTYDFYLQGPVAPCLEAEPPCDGIEEPEVVALPAGKLLGSFVGQSVSADLSSAGISLHAGAHYWYWVTAASAAGTTRGTVQRFVAPEDGVQPLNTTTPSSTTGPASSSGQGTVTPAATGGSTPAVNAASKPAHGKPSTKHGKRRKHKHHGKHLGKGHKTKKH